MSTLTRISGIYRINCSANGKFYVGSSQNIGRRWQTHVRNLRNQTHHNPHLQHAWDKFGGDAFSIELLEETPTNELTLREQVWLDRYLTLDRDRCFNVSTSADSPMRGRKHSKTTRQRFSRSRRGAQNANYRNKYTACLTCGKKFHYYGAKNVRKYCSHKCYAVAPKSDETLRKHRNAAKGRPRDKVSVEIGADQRRKNYIVTAPDGRSFTVKGLARFCRAYGLDQGSLSAVVSGRRVHHKGWRCRPAALDETPQF